MPRRASADPARLGIQRPGERRRFVVEREQQRGAVERRVDALVVGLALEDDRPEQLAGDRARQLVRPELVDDPELLVRDEQEEPEQLRLDRRDRPQDVVDRQRVAATATATGVGRAAQTWRTASTRPRLPRLARRRSARHGPTATRRAGARGPGAGPAPRRPRRGGPPGAPRRGGAGRRCRGCDGMTASTKPIRPDAVLRSKRPAWWSIRYSTSGLALRDGRLPGRRAPRARPRRGPCRRAAATTRTSSSLTPDVVALELADEPGQRGHAERARLLAGRVDVVGERDPASRSGSAARPGPASARCRGWRRRCRSRPGGPSARRCSPRR